MTKTLNQIIFFFLHQNQNIFFSNIGNQNIFLEKKTITPPFKLNGRSLMGFVSDIQIYVIFLLFILVLIFLLILDFMIIFSLLMGYYTTCNGYFIKPIYKIKDLVFIFRLRSYAHFCFFIF